MKKISVFLYLPNVATKRQRRAVNMAGFLSVWEEYGGYGIWRNMAVAACGTAQRPRLIVTQPVTRRNERTPMTTAGTQLVNSIDSSIRSPSVYRFDHHHHVLDACFRASSDKIQIV